MDRRRFLCRFTVASAAVGLEIGCAERARTGPDGQVQAADAQGTAPSANHSATAVRASRRASFQVRGFTCITCAVGLEVMLRGVRGVTEASASYAENRVVIAFDEQLTSEDALKQFIAACGFSAS